MAKLMKNCHKDSEHSEEEGTKVFCVARSDPLLLACDSSLALQISISD